MVMCFGVPEDKALDGVDFGLVRNRPSYTALRARMRDRRPMTWLFLGDSITHGCVHTYGRRSYSEYLAWHIRNSLGRKDDIVINTAVSGATTVDALKCDPIWIERYKPDVVFIWYGMNDCSTSCTVTEEQYRNNINKLVNCVLNSGAIAILQTAQPSFDSKRKTKRYFDITRAIAEERKVMLIDHLEIWKSLGVGKKYLDDSVHPNAMGHLLIARTIASALDITGDSGLCTLSNRDIRGKAKCGDDLKRAILKQNYAITLIEQDRHMRVLCAGFSDGDICYKDAVQAAEDELRCTVHNKRFESMTRHFIKVGLASLAKAEERFSPHIVAICDGGVVTVRKGYLS